MKVWTAADALYADYGENAGGGIRGGKQDPIFAEGNAFFLREFPKLDYIRQATIIRSNPTFRPLSGHHFY